MTRMRTQRHSPRRASGFTIVELLLSLTVTGMIGVAVVMMLSAASYGTSTGNDMQSALVAVRTTSGRINAALRSSRMVLYSSSDMLVLWISDTRADDLPNISEIRVIERSPITKQLYSYAASFPAGWTEQQVTDADTAYPMNSNFATVATNLKTQSYYPGTLWATHVDALAWTLDNADSQLATLASYRMDITADDVTETAVGAVRLRNQP